MGLLPLSFAILLAACDPKIEYVFMSPHLPEPLLVCLDSPEPPTHEEATQRDVAIYILDLNRAHRSCHGNLESVRKIIDRFESTRKGEASNQPAELLLQQ